MPENGSACCKILFPVECHTLTGGPTAPANTERLYQNTDISKFSQRPPELGYIGIWLYCTPFVLNKHLQDRCIAESNVAS